MSNDIHNKIEAPKSNDETTPITEDNPELRRLPESSSEKIPGESIKDWLKRKRQEYFGETK
jgi:hypothetical protein